MTVIHSSANLDISRTCSSGSRVNTNSYCFTHTRTSFHNLVPPCGMTNGRSPQYIV
nr:MAG TPA: hypothetical protein [Caudoviricetes sp.]DAH69138.1 MAG TPA: hypothetical protein [Caudoviricetes sp.]DAN70689.1 MAG TPA: hypothetical protein [Caudoviricetes sp.]DAW92344.1 MAG TPA: hypothetical protein [Bacteriophage sp.]